MAEFGPEVTEAPEIAHAETEQRPVQPSTGGIRAFANVFGMAVEGTDNYLQGRANQANQQSLTAFQEEYINVIESARQGQIPRGAAQSRLNLLLLQYSQENPGLAKDFRQISGQLRGTAGGGSFLSEQTIDEKINDALRTKVFMEGWVDPNASESEINAAMYDFAEAERSSRSIRNQIESFELEMKEYAVGSARRQELEEAVQASTKRFLNTSLPGQTRDFGAKVNNILNSGADTATQLAQLDALWQEFETGSSQDLLRVNDSNFQTTYLKAFESLYNRARQVVTGETTREAWDAEMTNSLTAAKRGYMENPDIVALVAQTELFDSLFKGGGPMAQVLIERQAKVLLNAFEGNPQDSSTGDFTEAMRQVLKAEAGSDQAVQDQTTILNNGVATISDNVRRIERDASNAVEPIDWLSDPEFFSHVSNLDPTEVDGALRVLQDHYEEELYSMVSREFTKSNVVPFESEVGNTLPEEGGDRTPTPETVGVRGTPGGVEFYALDTGSPSARKEATRLNQQLKPVIDKSVKAFAHLEGHTNYQEVFTRQMDKYFPDGTAQEVKPIGELELKDFEDNILQASFEDGLDSLRNSLAQMESGHNYNAVGPIVSSGHHAGERAYGKYQVMEGNIGPWTEEHYGQSLSTAEFLGNTYAQEAVFAGEIYKSLKKYGSFEDAISVWFTGVPYAQALRENRRDVNLHVSQYVSGVLRGMQ